MATLILIFFSLFIFSACENESDLPMNYGTDTINHQTVYNGGGGVPNLGNMSEEINRYVTPKYPDCLGQEITTRELNSIQRDGSCIEFDLDFYKRADSGKKIAEAIANTKNIVDKKQAFLRYFGPLAVYVQDKTGYPASALLTQWADETAWGTSNQIKTNNNIGGHSCFRRNPNYKYPTKEPPPKYLTPQIDVKCTYKRPAKEGAYYMTFNSVLDAALSQVYNIAHNPSTQKYYSGTRSVLDNALRSGRKPDAAKVIEGLAGYAAFPAEYRSRLIQRMEKENYKIYDSKTICGDETK